MFSVPRRIPEREDNYQQNKPRSDIKEPVEEAKRRVAGMRGMARQTVREATMRSTESTPDEVD